MSQKYKLTTYLFAEVINLTLAYPFIYFLLRPEKSTVKLIGGVFYLLFLRIASIFASTELYRLKTKQKINFMSLACIALILWSVFSKVGLIVLVYFAGSMLMDALFLFRQRAKQRISFMLNLLYRSMLLLLLIPVAAIGSSLIHQRYYDATRSLFASTKTYKNIDDLLVGVLLIVLYYIFEPFAELIFNSLFDPKSKLAIFLHRKL